MDRDGDTICVRAEETLDEERLTSFLRGRIDGADGPLEVRQFGGGAANLTYLLRFGSREYVLRRPPLGPVAPTSHDMKREYDVLSVLHQAFPKAPMAYLYWGKPEVAGAPFILMERRRGVVVRKSMPAAYAGSRDAPIRMSQALIDTLAELHSVDYSQLGLDGLGRPEGFVQRQVAGWLSRWREVGHEGSAEMEEVGDWLSRRIPQSRSFSLVHNDYKLDNVMLGFDDPGRIEAVLDWDMCTLGDPLSDLGALLAYWSEPSDPPPLRAMAMMPGEGFPGRRWLVERYAERSGLNLDSIGFYHVLGLFRVAVIVAQIHVRYRRGQTSDKRFETFGQLVPILAQAALQIAQQNEAPL